MSSSNSNSTKGMFGPGGFLENLSRKTETESEETSVRKKRKLDDLLHKGSQPDSSLIIAATSNNNKKGDSEEDSAFKTAILKAYLKPDDISLEDTAFAIDHILEYILSHLPVNMLTETRLVSHRFNHISSKLLDTHLKMLISVPSKHTISIIKCDAITVATNLGLERRVKSLEALNSVLRVSGTKFPCTSFHLYTDDLMGIRVQTFFSIYGANIKSLRLSLSYISRKITEAKVLKELKTFLMTQVPSLQCLNLEVIMPNTIMPTPTPTPEVRKQQDALAAPATVLQQENFLDFVLPNLKSLDITGATFTIFERIMNAAVNLQTYEGQQDEFYNYFVQEPGMSRLHLFRSVSICITPHNSDLNRLEAIADLIQKNIMKLNRDSDIVVTNQNQIQIQLLQLSCICLYRSPCLWPRVSLAINKILKCSAETVETLCWEPIRFLRGIQIPIMPKVKDLVLLDAPSEVLKSFSSSSSDDSSGSNNNNNGYFPEGFDFARVFPALKKIIIFRLDKVPGITLSSLLALDLKSKKVFESVTSIVFKNSEGVFLEEKDIFSQVFPNAVILSE